MDYPAIVQKLMEHELPRSTPYMQGFAAVLKKRVEEVPVASPYRAGTAEDDAFYAGCMRGHNEFRNALQKANGNRNEALKELAALANARRAA